MFVFDLHQHHVCLELHVSPHSAQEYLHASCKWFGDSSHQFGEISASISKHSCKFQFEISIIGYYGTSHSFICLSC